MMLIRYMSLKWGPESLKSGLFKVLRPLDANDPYEMMGACCGKLRQEVESRMLADMREKWERSRLDNSYTQDWSEVENRVRDHRSYFRAAIMERQTQHSLNRTMSFVDANKVDTVTDQLMWAHYGEGGSGIRVWFDSNKLKSQYSEFYLVKYDDRRPCIDLGTLDNYEIDDAWGDFLKEVLIAKSKAWEYEHEVRMLISSRTSNNFITKRNGIEFISIPSDAIVRVDFGAKGKIVDTTKCVNEFRSLGCYGHVDFRVATFDEYEYKYHYLKYDDLIAGRGMSS